MGLEPLLDKWSSFGWNVIEIDGHDSQQMSIAFKNAQNFKDKPSVIIAHTIKGKGVSFMENSPTWHGSVAINNLDFKKALLELGASEAEIGEIINE
jgi:transketolase